MNAKHTAAVLSRFPEPHPTLDSKPYWDASREGVLRVQACTSCGRGIFPPRPVVCPFCNGVLGWRDVSRACTLYSWIGVDAAIHDWQQGVVPYAVTLVALSELPDCRIPCFFGGARGTLRIGARGSIAFVDIGKAYGVPTFAPGQM